MIALRDQEYYVSGLPKDLRIISPHGIIKAEGCRSTFIAHCHDEHYSYAEFNLKNENPYWNKAEPVERVYIKYDPNNNLPSHEAILPNQREKEAKALESAVCGTNEAIHNLNPSKKELLQWHYRLGNIGFQHVQWLILTWNLKVQVNSKAVSNCERPKCAACEFGMVRS